MFLKSAALALCLVSGFAFADEKVSNTLDTDYDAPNTVDVADGAEIADAPEAVPVAPTAAAVATPAPKAVVSPTKAYTADYPVTVKAGEKFTFKPNVAACKTGKGCGDFKKGQEVYVNKTKLVTKLFWSCPCPNCLLTKLKLSHAGSYTIDVKLNDGSFASFPVTVTE